MPLVHEMIAERAHRHPRIDESRGVPHVLTLDLMTGANGDRLLPRFAADVEHLYDMVTSMLLFPA
jgi:hypothetical protein